MSELDAANLTGDNAKLQSYFERVMRLNREIDSLKADCKDVFSQAKADGFDVKLMRQAIALAKKKESERTEQEEMLPIYFAVLQKAAV